MLVPGLLHRAQAYELLEDRTCNRCERLAFEVLAEPAQVILAIAKRAEAPMIGEPREHCFVGRYSARHLGLFVARDRP